jgi:hypothetical protein
MRPDGAPPIVMSKKTIGFGLFGRGEAARVRGMDGDVRRV